MRAIGIVLAGGNNHRMRELSNKRAVAAMPVAGSYRGIDFALSNMTNSGVQKVAVLTQYNARSLNEHLSSSKWWNFGRKQGGMFVFTPTITKENSFWYQGTADAIYQNLDFLKRCHEPYVIIASGDGVYKLDYNKVLEYHIQKKADRVLLFPADVPMITADTIEKMAQAPGSMAVPVCQGKKGHPVMLSKEVFGHILTYRGGKGLRGAMDAWGEGVREIEVEDPGVLLDTNTKMDYESLLAYEKDRQKRGELAFQASISLSREEECFSALTADFLEAVAESGSMLGACQIRDISYSKGWKMLKIAEAQLGIQFLERQTGGSKGGFSVLTPEGKAFLEKFRRMEAAVQAAAEAAFEKIFLEPEEEEKEDTDGREINAF